MEVASSFFDLRISLSIHNVDPNHVEPVVTSSSPTIHIEPPHTTLPLGQAKTQQCSDGMCDNEIYSAAQTYLATKIGPSIDLLKISKRCSEPNLTIKLARTEETIRDTFQGIELQWRFVQEKDHKKTAPSKRLIGKEDDEADIIVRSNKNNEKRYFELCFDKNHKSTVLGRYVPFVLEAAKTIESKNRPLKLHTLGVRGSYDSTNLDHPSTFDTLAMDPELKLSIMDDLDRFARSREFYRRVGRAWKRGYLLYGPPGTGKSSLIAAMANYLKFDVYDLELSNVKRDSDLRKLLLRTKNRSILVIEDINCSVSLPSRKEKKVIGRLDGKRRANCVVSLSPGDQQFTLSGLLNLIDGLWSSCVEERIIVFTTNDKDKLDPALLRPGRMDKHIHMSYLTPKGFRILASNHLNIRTRHSLFAEIEELLGQVSVTPAQVAEELMKKKTDDDDCLKGLVDFLKCKKMKTTNERAEQRHLQEWLM